MNGLHKQERFKIKISPSPPTTVDSEKFVIVTLKV